MLDTATLSALGISGAGLVLSIGAVAVGYGVTQQKADSATTAVDKLGDRMDTRLDALATELREIGGDVREIQGELKTMRNLE